VYWQFVGLLGMEGAIIYFLKNLEAAVLLLVLLTLSLLSG